MSESFLSQEEVDALLEGVTGESQKTEQEVLENGEVRNYDISSQERIVRGRMPTMEIVNERFARNFRIGLFNFIRPVIRRRWRVARRRRQHGGGSQIQIDGLQAEDARAFRLPRQCLERTPAEQVFQFAHVTRPVVRQQRRLGLGAQAQAAQVQARAVLFEEVPGQ